MTDSTHNAYMKFGRAAIRAAEKFHRCHECGSKRLRLEIPPDFEPFEVCRDCGQIQEVNDD